MKILLTTHQFLPDHCSGTEILTFETAKELQRLGHEVSVFAGFPQRMDIHDDERFDRYLYEGVSVTRFRHARVPMGSQTNIVEAEYNNHFFAAFFREYLKKYQPDIVHFYHLHRLSAAAVEVCHESRIPMVMTPTDFWLVCPMSQLRLPNNEICSGPDSSSVNCLRHIVALKQPKKTTRFLNLFPDIMVRGMIWGVNKGIFAGKWFAMMRALYERPAYIEKQMNRLDRMVLPSRLMKRILLEHGLKEEKVVSCPFGINFIRAERMSCPEGRGPLRIGFIGTMTEHKGALVLIEAIRLLPHLVCEVLLYGKLGDYPDYENKMKASADGDPRIRFCGTFPNSEIGKIFSNLDVLVVPSVWYENTPLVIYTAQAARCPVIAADFEGISEVVHHGENGLLFPAGNANALARQIESLILEPDRLKQLADRAVSPRSIQEYVSDLVKIYDDVISERCSQ